MFTGSVGSKRRVDLRGNSKGSETREQILERSRRDRERRKQLKLENSSAVVIQAAWRAKHDLGVAKSQIATNSRQQYGLHGEEASRSDIGLNATYVQALFLCADVAQEDEIAKLAQAASLVLTSQDNADPKTWQPAVGASEASALVSSRIWEVVIVSLHPDSFKDLSSFIAWLPADQPDGKAGAAAALLANLAQVSGAALQGGKRSQEEGILLATQFSEVVHMLLSVVPMSSILAVSDTVMADVDEEEDAAQPQASTSGSTEMLSWPTGATVSPALSAQLHCLAEPALLKPLVQQALPLHLSATAVDSMQQASTVRSLCKMLQGITTIPALCQKALIFTAGPADFVQRLWSSYLKAAWAQSSWVSSNDDTSDPGWMLPIIVLCRVYATYLNTTPDTHTHRQHRPLPLEQLYNPDSPAAGLLSLLKFALWQVLWVESPSSPMTAPSKALRAALKEAAGKLLSQLYDRNCRRQFVPLEAFQTDSLPPERFRVEMQTAAAAAGGLMQATNTRVWGLLRHAPFLIAFQERAQVFTTVVGQDRMEQREMGMREGYGWGRQYFVTIHRTTLLQDGFEQLNKLAERLKSRLQIRFIDQHGLEEAGIDGGGLFKEFMECLVKEGFNPNAALFKATSDNRLYPHPAAQALVPNALAYFEFLGRMLGKAMYEGVLIELPLAGFFLKKMRNPHSDVNDLVTLDPELYRNLMFMRDYDGDFADLALTFTVADSDAGHNREVELVPGGSGKAVTAENVVEYIHRVADYRLNYQIKAGSEAFWRGFFELVAHDWVTMFNEEEIQMLISGGGEGVDIADLQAHVNYAGGYHPEHPVILDFWKVVAEFTAEQQSQLLKFVTACSRAPLLGFKYLEPGLSIQMAGSSLDPHASDRLPTAATCMNLLKLPPYRSAHQIRDKLLYAAKNAGGFDLS
ncbi:MAG: E3 ubiquitin- ligase UPL6 [Trebouxia sp. A1-2]|nr:MAG: E3 ubiquitin- ligase UPL6 [Trebouxia sp. A1-2]